MFFINFFLKQKEEIYLIIIFYFFICYNFLISLINFKYLYEKENILFYNFFNEFYVLNKNVYFIK